VPPEVIIAILAPLLLVALLGASVKVIREYERAVTFRLGRLRGPLGPGLVVVLPLLEKMVRVDLRVVTLTIPPQEVITKDNVTARVNAVVMFRVADPVRSVMAVENHAVATSQFAQTTLRSVVGRADLDTLLAHRADLNEDLAQSIAHQTEPWGVDVSVVEIKDVEIPEIMQRAMAREAEAERERRAKVISARGELCSGPWGVWAGTRRPPGRSAPSRGRGRGSPSSTARKVMPDERGRPRGGHAGETRAAGPHPARVLADPARRLPRRARAPVRLPAREHGGDPGGGGVAGASLLGALRRRRRRGSRGAARRAGRASAVAPHPPGP
jgi:hypothetical protein